MLRSTTFAIVSLFACGVASAQQPFSPVWNGWLGNTNANCANGYCPPQSGVHSVSSTNPGMICGPNGCYVPGQSGASQYHSPLYSQPNTIPHSNQYMQYDAWSNPTYRTVPAYSAPSSSYPGFPNIPSARRDRSLPTTTGYPQYVPPTANHWNQYDAYRGPGVLH